MATEPNAAAPPPAAATTPSAASAAAGRAEPAADRLGPLVRVDGRWILGDHRQRAHLTFEPAGLVHRVVGREPHPVAWDRLMELGVAVTADRFSSSRVGGLLSRTPGITTHGSCLRAMVRHPYDMWSAGFSHHRAFYPSREIVLLQSLLGLVVDRKRAELLGDDAWLTTAVRGLAAHRPAVRWRRPDGVAELVDELLAQAS
ncbi:hypothetical protein OG618_28820 [Kitasatospora sp. NBC_01246]|uniref:hypothetical protein n=1 Tax=Kitasatospora sp. NBC_01246 TaxID=2903570 RepID=UPI002E34CD90|nr:hypothetical protein [Kitasatospora sp. NBC_01246]